MLSISNSIRVAISKLAHRQLQSKQNVVAAALSSALCCMIGNYYLSSLSIWLYLITVFRVIDTITNHPSAYWLHSSMAPSPQTRTALSLTIPWLSLSFHPISRLSLFQILIAVWTQMQRNMPEFSLYPWIRPNPMNMCLSWTLYSLHKNGWVGHYFLMITLWLVHSDSSSRAFIGIDSNNRFRCVWRCSQNVMIDSCVLHRSDCLVLQQVWLSTVQTAHDPHHCFSCIFRIERLQISRVESIQNLIQTMHCCPIFWWENALQPLVVSGLVIGIDNI